MTRPRPSNEDDLDATNIARKFLLFGVQEWGQADDARRTAAIAYLTLAGIDDVESKAASEFLAQTCRDLRRGKLEHEIDQLVAAAAARRNL